MVVLGGMGNIKGAIIAAVILTALPEVLRSAADYRMLLYAIVLIAMMLFNNSKFRMAIIEKRNLKKSMNIQKEGE
jgi:branched-chain amino acid transport system permease protein